MSNIDSAMCAISGMAYLNDKESSDAYFQKLKQIPDWSGASIVMSLTSVLRLHHAILVKNGSTLTLAFSGTQTSGNPIVVAGDWGVNLMLNQTPWYPPTMPWCGKVHIGFYSGVLSLCGLGLDGLEKNVSESKLKGFGSIKVTAIVNEMINALKDDTITEIYFTGHSQGGAMASIALPFLKSYLFDTLVRKRRKKTLNLVTFAAPRVGNMGFAFGFNYHADSAVRYANPSDFVTWLPIAWNDSSPLGILKKIVEGNLFPSDKGKEENQMTNLSEEALIDKMVAFTVEEEKEGLGAENIQATLAAFADNAISLCQESNGIITNFIFKYLDRLKAKAVTFGVEFLERCLKTIISILSKLHFFKNDGDEGRLTAFVFALLVKYDGIAEKIEEIFGINLSKLSNGNADDTFGSSLKEFAGVVIDSINEPEEILSKTETAYGVQWTVGVMDTIKSLWHFFWDGSRFVMNSWKESAIDYAHVGSCHETDVSAGFPTSHSIDTYWDYMGTIK